MAQGPQPHAVKLSRSRPRRFSSSGPICTRARARLPRPRRARDPSKPKSNGTHSSTRGEFVVGRIVPGEFVYGVTDARGQGRERRPASVAGLAWAVRSVNGQALWGAAISRRVVGIGGGFGDGDATVRAWFSGCFCSWGGRASAGRSRMQPRARILCVCRSRSALGWQVDARSAGTWWCRARRRVVPCACANCVW